jgi:hypothetical protein
VTSPERSSPRRPHIEAPVAAPPSLHAMAMYASLPHHSRSRLAVRCISQNTSTLAGSACFLHRSRSLERLPALRAQVRRWDQCLESYGARSALRSRGCAAFAELVTLTDAWRVASRGNTWAGTPRALAYSNSSRLQRCWANFVRGPRGVLPACMNTCIHTSVSTVCVDMFMDGRGRHGGGHKLCACGRCRRGERKLHASTADPQHS